MRAALSSWAYRTVRGWVLRWVFACQDWEGRLPRSYVNVGKTTFRRCGEVGLVAGAITAGWGV